MRRAILALGLAGCVQCGWAETRADFALTSDYVWRGFTLSDDAPSVMGGIAFRHDDGWFASAHVAGVRVDSNEDGKADSNEQLGLIEAGVAKPWRDAVLELGTVIYEYTRGDQFNPATGSLEPGTSNKDDFVELFVGVRYGNGRFRYYRSEDYRGSGKLGNYFDLWYETPLWDETTRAILHYGFTDSSAIDDHSSQLSDTAFGIAKGEFEFLVTHLADNEDGRQSRNPRFVFSWRHGIEF